MKHILYILLTFGFSQSLWSQSNPSAIFEIESTNQGMLVPRTDTTSVNNSYAVPATGLLIYDSLAFNFCVFDGLKWEKIGPNINPTSIEDADQDTRIYMEESTDDKIKVDLSLIHI